MAVNSGRTGLDLSMKPIWPKRLRPGGSHRRFIDRKANGIRYLSFRLQPEKPAAVDAMRKVGINAEFSTSLRNLVRNAG